MVRSKEELLAMATEWANHAKNDIRNQLIKFMEGSGLDQRSLADILCMTEADIDQILNGNGDISILTFAKMLIASDMVLEIKPMSAAPRGARVAPSPRSRGPIRDANGRFVSPKDLQMPPRGGMPMPPRGTMPMGGMPMPPRGTMPMGGMPMPPRGAMPMGGMPMPTRGGYPTPAEMGHAPYGATPQCQEIELDELDRKELIDLINRGGYAREIDTRSAQRKELIAFLEAKQQEEVMREMPQIQPNAHTEAVETAPVVEAAETNAQPTNNADAIARAFAEQIQNNPQLANVLGQLLNIGQ